MPANENKTPQQILNNIHDDTADALNALLVDANGNALLDANGVKVQGAAAHDAANVGNPLKVGGRYQAGTPDTVDDDDAADILVDDSGRLIMVGPADSDAPELGAPIQIAGSVDESGTVNADEGDVRRIRVSPNGYLLSTQITASNNQGDGDNPPRLSIDSGGNARAMAVGLNALAPDALYDRLRTGGDSGPGLGALNVAQIGGDLALRASAAAGEASGTSTALDDVGWVKSFWARLDVTAAPSGGSPTLDVYIQTQSPSGDWQDIVGFTRATGVTHENVSWGPWTGELSQILAEAASGFAVDEFFADQDAAIGDATVRAMVLGDSLRVKWVFAAGGSTGDFTFAVDSALHN